MKKKLKIALCILIIVLISVIAFIGVYAKALVSYESQLPEYVLGTELTGKRISYFKLSDETEEKIYDKDGNEVESIPEDANEEDYTRENVKVNPDEKLTEENYNKVKEIFEGRLKEMGVEEYTVRLNHQTGEVVVELEENTNTDKFIQYLQYKGDFSMTDSEDGTLLISKDDIEKASVVYRNTGTR